MTEKELETTTAELSDRSLRPAGIGHADPVRRLRAPSTRRVRTTDRRRRSERCRRSPRATRTTVEAVDTKQHFTEPPPRYTEASLIKALEEHGIGRPSTYAATISTIVDRGYVIVKERRLHPEPVGEIVTDLLVGQLRRPRGSRVHGAHGRGPGRGRERLARVAARSCATSTRRSARSSTARPRSCAGRTSRRGPATRSAPRATRW